jgi:hypothetical protein
VRNHFVKLVSCVSVCVCVRERETERERERETERDKERVCVCVCILNMVNLLFTEAHNQTKCQNVKVTI